MQVNSSAGFQNINSSRTVIRCKPTRRGVEGLEVLKYSIFGQIQLLHMTNCSLDGQQRLGSVALCISFPRVRFKIWSRQAVAGGGCAAGGGNGGIDAECFQG